MKRVLLFLLLLGGSISSFSQELEVKKIQQDERDQTAVDAPRRDINGNLCGLVRVQLKEEGAQFEGNVMGDVQFTGSEYLVFLPNGTKRLGIKHPDYLPTTIVFADYGTKKIESGVTYQLKVKANKKKAKVDNSKKGMAVFNIKPSNAMLLIDGQIADGSGGAYTLSLPFGTHYYTVKIKDFSINNQILHIDKEAKNINVDLTEYFAKLDVTCQTTDAEILVNSEQMGAGRWGSMVVPGSYTIEAQKDGCHPQSRQVVLKDNDVVQVDFPALKTITGSLRVDYEPAGADVLLNGKKVGVTPLVLKELPVGDYQLEIWKEYYVKEAFKIRIQEDIEWKESGKLKVTEFGQLVEDAEKGDPLRLAKYYKYGWIRGYRGSFETFEKDSLHMPINPVKAMYWLKRMEKKRYDSEWEHQEVLDLLGPCYPSETDDAILSFCWAKDASGTIDYEADPTADPAMSLWMGDGTPYVALAWHYFYGIGCEKNVDEAKKIMRWICNGECPLPAFIELIKDMGLDNELKYNPSHDE